MRIQQPEPRRLLALLVGDIVGYSRLMAVDEADTFHRLKDLQSSLILPATQRNRGRIVKWIGDGFIATFESAVDAVRAAVEIQSGVATVGAESPEERRIRFRIGVNAGDVIITKGDVYGDAVNITARLQTLAPPGGICVSRAVRDTVKGKFGIEFEDQGDLQVKNIPDPVGAYSAIFNPVAWTPDRETAAGDRARWHHPRVLGSALAILVLGLAVLGLSLGWLKGLGSSRTPADRPAAVAPVPTDREAAGAGAQSPSSRLAAAMPTIPMTQRETAAKRYAEARGEKALAISTERQGSWMSSGNDSVDVAEQRALESCQFVHGSPCLLFARNDEIFAPNASGGWVKRDMPRVVYAGPFAIDQIPSLAPNIRSGATVQGYAAASSPKAMTFHPQGRVFAAVGAPSQKAAEEAALTSCNDDPARRGEDGPCFLYAVGNQVILPQRLTRPVDDPYSRITAAGLLAGPLAYISNYAALPRSKAIAVHVEAGRLFQWDGVDSPERARRLALEGCQMTYGGPCALLAVNADLIAPDPRAAPRSDMPRLRYQGSYDPDQVPFLRLNSDLRQYASLPGPKAIAVRPERARAIVVHSASSLNEAERQALALCNDGLSRSPCFLYASGTRVILPERRTQASQ